MPVCVTFGTGDDRHEGRFPHLVGIYPSENAFQCRNTFLDQSFAAEFHFQQGISAIPQMNDDIAFVVQVILVMVDVPIQ